MGYRDKNKERAYAREYYLRNRERILKRNRRQGDDDEEVDCCRYCMRLSRSGGDTAGWCLKHRRKVQINDICSYFRREEKVRYDYPVHAVTIFEGE